ncbi:MAG: glycerol kinase GlpK [Anaerovoracaceae bacterium]
MSGYYLGIDQGTTLTTAVLVDERWCTVAKASKPHKQQYLNPGWVEHDPIEIYENCIAVAAEVLQKVPGATAQSLIAVGLDHQGETCMIWDKNTGIPIYNAIVWQDRRTSDAADQLKKNRGEEIRKISGLMPDAYFSALKLNWLLDHVEGARARVEKGELLMGTLNTWLFWKMSGGESYRTDPSSAACMMLMDLHQTEWSSILLDLIGVSEKYMPEICDTNTIYGYTKPECFLGAKIPMAGSAVDTPASIIGGGCVGEGILKTSYGTGSFMSFQTGSRVILSKKGLFSDCLWRIDGKPFYRLRGASYVAGAAVEWLKSGLGIVNDVRMTEQMALSVPDTCDVYFVPAFSGLATPFWDQYARGLFIGLTAGVTKEHMVRAVLESLAYQVANCYRAMRSELGRDSSVMRVDGGMVENRFVMQFQSDMLGIPLEVPEEKETAAYGAACLAGVTLGSLASIESVKQYVKLKCVFEPKMSSDEREERMTRWLDAANRSLGWAK